MHNSNKKIVQVDLWGIKVKETREFVGICALEELRSCNDLNNDKAWVHVLDKILEKITNTINKNAPELYSANYGLRD